LRSLPFGWLVLLLLDKRDERVRSSLSAVRGVKPKATSRPVPTLTASQNLARPP
jgi:hypothetical protein